MHIITLFSSRLFSLRSDPLLLFSSAQSRQCFFLNRSTQWRKMWESFSSRCTAAETSARSSWWSATLSRVRTSLSSTSSNTFALGALAMHAADGVREGCFIFVSSDCMGPCSELPSTPRGPGLSSLSKGPISIRRKTNCASPATTTLFVERVLIKGAGKCCTSHASCLLTRCVKQVQQNPRTLA